MQVIFIGLELLFTCRTSDEPSILTTIHAQLGSPIFESYMQQADDTFGLYLFMQSTNVNRIQKLRKNYRGKKSWLYANDCCTKGLNDMLDDIEKDFITRMHWHGANNTEI